MPLPALAGLALGAGSAMLGFFGQKRTNEQNREMAREQMAFQERMSSTAYQRSMADMRKAGLNPLLAYQQGGASSPGGATARMDNEVEAAASGAKDALRLKSELKSMASSRELMYNQARLAANASAREAANVQVLERDQVLKELQANILTLQIPALVNSARVSGTQLGRTGAFIDRIRQMVLGGRGFFNPIGGR